MESSRAPWAVCEQVSHSPSAVGTATGAGGDAWNMAGARSVQKTAPESQPPIVRRLENAVEGCGWSQAGRSRSDCC